MSASRRLTDHERGRIAILLSQIDPPSVRTISERFGLDPSTIHKIRKDSMRTGSRQIVANAESKAPEAWQMTHGELRDKLTPANKTQLAGMRHLLPKLFPEYTDHEPEPNNDYHYETHRAYHKGDTLPRLPFVQLSKKHRAAIKEARAAGQTIPQAVLDDYPGV